MLSHQNQFAAFLFPFALVEGPESSLSCSSFSCGIGAGIVNVSEPEEPLRKCQVSERFSKLQAFPRRTMFPLCPLELLEYWLMQ